MKKFLFFFLLIFLVLIAIGLIMPSMGRVSPEKARARRVETLNAWQKSIKIFIQERGRPPTSLYEVYSNGFLEDISKRLTVSSRDTPPIEVMSRIYGDQRLFDDLVEFVFLVSKNGWFVKELKYEFLYPYKLMIDQDGKIYEIRETTKDNILD